MRETITATTLEEFKAKMRELKVTYIMLSRNEKLEYNKLKNTIYVEPTDEEENKKIVEKAEEIENKNAVLDSFSEDYIEELKKEVEVVTVEDKDFWMTTKNGILNALYDRIMDGDFRSILLKEREKEVSSKHDVEICIQKLVDVVQDGEERAIIYEYVNQIRK